MRILIAHARYRIPAGEDRYVDQLAGLLNARHDIRLLDPKNAELEGGLSSFARMVYSREMVRHVGKEIDEFRPDVIHLHNVYPSLGPAVHLAAEERGIPIVMTVHNYRLRCPNGLMFTEGELCTRCTSGNHLHAVLHECFPERKQAVAYATALWIHRSVIDVEGRVSVFVAPSRFVADQLVEWGIASSRIAFVRNFTDVASSTSPSSLSRHGLYLGRLSSEKGLDLLLHALERAGDPEFLIVGEGPESSRLRRLATSLGLAQTRFLERVPHAEVPEIIRSARFLAVPSLWHETAGLAALEAMAAGRPLLVSDRGGLPELVSEGGGLAWSPSDGVGALTALIMKLGKDDDLVRSLGDQARKFAVKHLSAGTHLEGIESVYEKARGG